jgi:formylglycine-generating enzyme required for sulfatase activity
MVFMLRLGLAEEVMEHVSSTGLKFVEIPGTTALVAVYETRLSDWNEFLEGSGYTWSFKAHFEQEPNHPVVGVNLQDAQAFCNWLTEKERAEEKINSAQSYRLPTRSDWDAAAAMLRSRKLDLTVEEKVQDERAFFWGLAWPPPAGSGNYAETEIEGYSDGYPFTSPVGSFGPSEEGVFDLAGNVWEWTWDMTLSADQRGYLRGGSWAYFRPACLTKNYQYQVPVEMRAATIGFRCVFEDKQRTAKLLAAADAERAEQRAKRREELMGNGEVDQDALEAMRKRLSKGSAGPALPDPADLTKAAAGSSFLNTLGMDFLPVEGLTVLAGAHEVRVQDYEVFLKKANRSWNDKPSFLLGGGHPVAGVSWKDAKAFCGWLTEVERELDLIPEGASYRLPTDIEWSRLAGLEDEAGANPAERHAKTKDHFPWTGDGTWPPPSMSVNLDASKIGEFSDSYAYTAPVATAEQNPSGVNGLGGNVSEWCEDPWPEASEERVYRGGSYLFFDKHALLTSARRHASEETTRADLGFRCVLDLGSGS